VLRFGLVLGLVKVGVWVRILGFRLVLGFGLRFSASVKRVMFQAHIFFFFKSI
jgi:hypothetical protein